MRSLPRALRPSTRCPQRRWHVRGLASHTLLWVGYVPMLSPGLPQLLEIGAEDGISHPQWRGDIPRGRAAQGVVSSQEFGGRVGLWLGMAGRDFPWSGLWSAGSRSSRWRYLRLNRMHGFPQLSQGPFCWSASDYGLWRWFASRTKASTAGDLVLRTSRTRQIP